MDHLMTNMVIGPSNYRISVSSNNDVIKMDHLNDGRHSGTKWTKFKFVHSMMKTQCSHLLRRGLGFDHSHLININTKMLRRQ